MTGRECWREGDLRSWLDGELPSGRAAALESHLGECAACRRIRDRLAECAEWAAVSLAELTEAEMEPRHVPPPAFGADRAAGLGRLALLAAVVTVMAVVPFVRKSTPEKPSLSAPRQTSQVVAASAETSPPPARRARMHGARRPARRAPAVAGGAFLALDDDPIETGLVVKVALDSGVMADVIVDAQGTPRAIRLEN